MIAVRLMYTVDVYAEWEYFENEFWKLKLRTHLQYIKLPSILLFAHLTERRKHGLGVAQIGGTATWKVFAQKTLGATSEVSPYMAVHRADDVKSLVVMPATILMS